MSEAQAKDVSLGERWQGAYCGVAKPSQQVIQDADAWEKLWKEVHSTRSPQPELPQIDFDKQAVLAVFLGEKNSGGYGIQITAVKMTKDGLEVHVKETSPAPGAITTQALTQPYDLVVIDKPSGPVKFVTE